MQKHPSFTKVYLIIILLSFCKISNPVIVHSPGEADFYSQERGLSLAWNAGVSDMRCDTALSFNTTHPRLGATVQQNNFGLRHVNLQ